MKTKFGIIFGFLVILLAHSNCSNSKDTNILGFFNNGSSVPQANINLVKGSSSLTEGGTSVSYTISLEGKPTSDVIIEINTDSQVSVNQSSLTFTSSNYSETQTIEVSAVDDSDIENNHSGTVSHVISTSDSNYASLSLDDLTFDITDNDSAGVSITETGSSTDVTEGSSVTDSYTIALTTEPTSNVTIDVSFDASELSLNGSTSSPIQLTFTSGNWSTPQTINVEALYDALTEGSHTSTISHSVSSSDPKYNSFSLSSVTVNITDTEGPLLNGSIQSGTSSSTGDISITSVDSSKAFVFCGFRISSSAANNFSTCQLNSSGDTVSFESGGGSSVGVNWYVAEFSDGVSVQRGSETLDSSTDSVNITLTSVDLAKSFVIVYSRMNSSSTSIDERRTVMAELTSSTNLQISRNETGTAIDVEWQVVEMIGANVQSGTTTMTGTSATANITSVDEGSTFLIFNSKASSNVNGVENRFYTRGTITDDTTITFNRETGTGSVDISWFAIEMLDGTIVQKGTGSESGGSYYIDDSIPNPVADTTKTMVVYSNTVKQPGNLSSSSDQDSGNYSYEFLDDSNLRFTRGQNENPRPVTLDWFTVEFQ